MGTTTDDEPDAGVDSRQVLLVALCLFGLFTAAFLAPVTGTNPPVGGDGDGGLVSDIVRQVLQFLLGDSDPGDGGGGGGSDGDGDGDGGIPEWLLELLRELIGDRDPGDGGGSDSDGDGGDGDSGDGDGGGNVPEWLRELLRELIGNGDGGGGDGAGEAPCRVLVEQNPTPGAETTVRVLEDGYPASGVRVWFNDRYVGETGEDGAVTGVVPYADRLNVTVQSDATCTFTRTPTAGAVGGGAGSVVSTALDSAPGPSVASAGLATPLQRTLGVTGAPVPGRDEGYAQADEGVNSSGEVQVDGDAAVQILGKPYPNATLEVVAAAGGTPIPDANVSIDGERVGQTNTAGRYALTVPDRDRIRVTVSRGAVSGTTTIDIWQLQIGFVPRVTVPGETVTANVTTPGGPVSNASVTLAGRELGTTAPDGRVQFRAPAAVDGTITATTSRQSATVPLWRVYGVTVGASALLVALSTVSTAAVARRSGRGRARRVAGLWLAVATLFVGFAIGELLGLLAALAFVAVLALYVFREWVIALLVWLAAAAERAAQWFPRAVLGIVTWLETVVDTLRAGTVRFVAWLRRQPRSVSGLLARLRGWLADLPAHLRAAGASTAGRVVVAALLAVGLVVISTLLGGPVGFLVSVALVVLVAVGWLIARYRADRESESPTGTSAASPTESAPPGSAVGRPSLRALWRRVARWVLPESWRTRTPAEIARAATDAGLPRDPVERLAAAFRDVEYGGRSEADRMDEAWRAYESLDVPEEDDG